MGLFINRLPIFERGDGDMIVLKMQKEHPPDALFALVFFLYMTKHIEKVSGWSPTTPAHTPVLPNPCSFL